MARFELLYEDMKRVKMLDMISQQIHEAAVSKARKYLVAEAELLRAIMDVDRNKIYEKLSETYLTPYCVKYLHLTEDVAAMFVRVARRSHVVPELEAAVQDGLQISKARTIASVIDSENKDEWIEKARTLTKANLEREVAAANPSALRPEKAKPTGPNRVRYEFEVTDEEDLILKRACELQSQKKNKNAGIGETIVVAVREWVDRVDPVRKAERAHARKLKKQNQAASKGSGEGTGSSEKNNSDQHQSQDRSNSNRSGRSHNHSHSRSAHRSQDRSLPAELVHQVNLRDRGACRKRMPDGSFCGCRKWTDIHHIIERAYGGKDVLENLVTLCKAHHRQLHRSSA